MQNVWDVFLRSPQHWVSIVDYGLRLNHTLRGILNIWPWAEWWPWVHPTLCCKTQRCPASVKVAGLARLCLMAMALGTRFCIQYIAVLVLGRPHVFISGWFRVGLASYVVVQHMDRGWYRFILHQLPWTSTWAVFNHFVNDWIPFFGPVESRYS